MVADVTGEQGMVAQNIDLAGQATGIPVDLLNRFRGKERS